MSVYTHICWWQWSGFVAPPCHTQKYWLILLAVEPQYFGYAITMMIKICFELPPWSLNPLRTESQEEVKPYCFYQGLGIVSLQMLLDSSPHQAYPAWPMDKPDRCWSLTTSGGPYSISLVQRQHANGYHCSNLQDGRVIFCSGPACELLIKASIWLVTMQTGW